MTDRTGADPLDSHFAECLFRLRVPLWRWRFDLQLHRVDAPDADARGWEIALHLWTKTTRGGFGARQDSAAS